MSSVFEAVSDNRLFGVDFEPGQIVVVQAMNYGGNYETNDIDSAFSARNAMYVKDSLDEGDVAETLAYMKAQNYSSVIINYLASKSPSDVVEMMMSVEENPEFGRASPTKRSWFTLNQMIKLVDKNMFIGATIDYDGSQVARFVQPLPTNVGDMLSSLRDIRSLIPSNWAGFDDDIKPIEFGGKIYSPKSFIQGLDDIIEGLRKGDYDNSNLVALGRNISIGLSKIVAIDEGVKSARRLGIYGVMGERFGSDFEIFYNQEMGRGSIELKDVDDVDKAVKYIQRVFAIQTDQLVIIDTLSKDAIKHSEIYSGVANKIVRQCFFQGLVKVIIDERSVPDFFATLISVGESNNRFYLWFEDIFTDKKFSDYVIATFNIRDPEQIAAVEEYNKVKLGL